MLSLDLSSISQILSSTMVNLLIFHLLHLFWQYDLSVLEFPFPIRGFPFYTEMEFEIRASCLRVP
jgi:hypothetical protein